MASVVLSDWSLPGAGGGAPCTHALAAGWCSGAHPVDTGLAGADLGPHRAQARSRSATGWLGGLGKSPGLVELSSKVGMPMRVLQVVISPKVSPGCVPSTARDPRQVPHDGQVVLFSAVRTAPTVRAARPREGRALGVLCFLSGEMTAEFCSSA